MRVKTANVAASDTDKDLAYFDIGGLRRAL